MSELHLITGNKNYSSWSLRAWICLKHLGIPFRETLVRLDQAQFKEQVARYGPTGRVPVLLDGELSIWDSLAICEYAAEVAGRGWPADRAARAIARSVCAEMHSGFTSLRAQWPMNARARNRHTVLTAELQADLGRIDAIWSDCRRRFGRDGGAWLFGRYTVADAMYAPVVLRFNTYGAPLSETAQAYVATALEDAALQEWLRDAQNEPWTIPHDEVG
ncbi:MAG TPA: glutathione S-transferase family protein [Steroidobacteraceae bacterium]|nr:glutathione S-transferase family protein [Steroidobacteraceae bacterium]